MAASCVEIDGWLPPVPTTSENTYSMDVSNLKDNPDWEFRSIGHQLHPL
jgi:hypothetical protein